MANDELKRQWQPVLRWIDEVRNAQATVFGEEGVLVPVERALSHIFIETGGTGDPHLKSHGVNQCCPHPGQECTPDCRAWGLFQIFWPPFRGVNWDKALSDPVYECYLGLKTLAVNYKACGQNWDQASNKFFSGSCTPSGTCDHSTGTCESDYAQAMHDHMAELDTLGIGDGPGDPTGKVPPATGTNGGGGDRTCLGPFCLPDLKLPTGTAGGIDTELLDTLLGSWLRTAAIVVLAAGLILIGIARVT